MDALLFLFDRLEETGQMKKSLLVVAIAGAVAGVAQAQVTLYGVVDAGYQYNDLDRTGAQSISGIVRPSQPEPLRLRGSEDLGGG
jgi:predicted porin